MTTFPPVLTQLPSLEILDISRNKIRKLPTEPGRLLRLKVLSLSNNRIKRLPVWIAKMKDLRVLKLEANPISWPPPNISVVPSAVERAASSDTIASSSTSSSSYSSKKHEDRMLAVWLAKLKKWIEENGQETESGAEVAKPTGEGPSGPLRGQPDAEERTRIGEESTSVDERVPGEAKRKDTGSDSSSRQGDTTSRRSPDYSRDDDLRARTTGGGSTSVETSPVERASPVSERENAERRPERPPRRFQQQSHLQQSLSMSPASSSTERRVANASPPPPQTNGKAQIPVPRVPSIYSPSVETRRTEKPSLEEPRRLAQHGRNNSHSAGQSTTFEPAAILASASNSRLSRTLSNKKSLPDLRQTHGDILSQRQESFDSQRLPSDGDENGKDSNSDEGLIYDRQVPQQAQEVRRPRMMQSVSHELPLQKREASPTATFPNGRKASLPTSILPYHADRKDTDLNAGGIRRAPVSAATISKMGPSASSSGDSKAIPAPAPPTSGGAVEVERNSYFRRLSTLPPSTISKAISAPVLRFIDATRGVLYALSQIHTALRQYVVFATDERMTGQLSRALEIASATMGNLINSLDRFDSVSRTRGGAEPDVVRGVIFACGESVATFRKVVSVLQIQLKTLHSGADVRYTRTLLLLLYGSMAEVAHCWNTMAPLIDEVTPFLNNSREPIDDARFTPLQTTPHSTLPSIAEASSPNSPKTARSNGDESLQQQQQSSTPSSAPRPYRRRHAGSFSAHDVAQGAVMGVSKETVPALPSGGGAVPTSNVSSGLPSQAETVTSSNRKGRPSALGRLPPHKASGNWRIEQGGEGTGSRPSTPIRSHSGDIGGPTTPASAISQQLVNGSGGGDYSWNTPSSSVVSMPAAGGNSAPATTTRFGGLSQSMHGESPERGAIAAMGSRRTISNASSSRDRNPPPTPFTPYAYANSAGPIVDEHLLLLAARFTSITLSVCSSLSDHLNSVGIGIAAPSRERAGTPSANEQASPNSSGSRAATKSPEGTPTLASAAALVSSPSISPVRNRSVTPTAAVRSPTTSSAASSAYGEAGGLLTRSASISNQKKLRQLRELCGTTAELTRRLQMSLNKVQEHILHPPDLEEGEEGNTASSMAFTSPGGGDSRVASSRSFSPTSSARSVSATTPAARGAPGWTTYPLLPAQDSERLHKDCSLLLRSVVQLSAMAKSSSVQLANISQAGTFPRALSRGLVGLMQSSRDVTLHLGFLKGGATSTSATFTSNAHAKSMPTTANGINGSSATAATSSLSGQGQAQGQGQEPGEGKA